MADDQTVRRMPAVNAPSSRVTIAFPFSQVKVTEARDETRELAAVVVALAQHIAALSPSPDTEALAAQAQDLLTKLG
jgi:hypothetical protein